MVGRVEASAPPTLQSVDAPRAAHQHTAVNKPVSSHAARCSMEMTATPRKMARWGDAKTLRFLRLYRINEALWNVRSVAYKNKTERALGYQNIQEGMNDQSLDMANIKAKIKNLRTVYLHERRKVVASRELDGSSVYKPSLPWYDLMDSFLGYVDLDVPRRIKLEPDEYSEDNTLNGNRSTTNSITHYQRVHRPESRQLVCDHLHNYARSSDPPSESADQSYGTESKPHQTRTDDYEPVLDAIRRLESISNVIDSTQQLYADDEFHLFALSVAAQLRKMPLHQAVDTQAKIQSVLSMARLETIFRNSPAPSFSDRKTRREKSAGGSGSGDVWGHVGDRSTWVCSAAAPYDRETREDLREIAISDLTWPRFGSRLSLKHFRNDAQHNDYITRTIDATEINSKRKHLDVKQWLKILDLPQYEDVFEKFSGVEDLLDFSEADIKQLGVRKSSHRALMMSSITALKAKYHDIKRDHFIRHSVAVDNRRKIQQEDSISDIKTVYEAIQTKSLNNLIMEPCADPSMDAAALKKALEWELSLDGRDIRSHAWYHGAIPRSRAEEIVREEGGFLVRDCTSQPGNYVLTCRTKLQPLHFVIKKTILQPETVYERVQYQFEDDPFDTVPDLITSYVGSGKPITAASGARIQFPKNRMYPLSFYASKYPAPVPQNRLISPAGTPGGLRYNPMQHSHSPTRLSNPSPPRLPSKKQRSQSLTPSEVNRIAQEKCNSADGVIQPAMMTRSAGSDTINHKFASLPRTSCARLSISPSTGTLGRHIRLCSDTSLCEDDTTPESPPPKPSRFPSVITRDAETVLVDGTNVHGYLQRVTSYHASGSDSGNGSGDSALSSAAGDPVELTHRNSGVIIKNPRYNLASSESTTTLKNFDFDYAAAEERLLRSEQPELDVSSRFDLENFHTLLLPMDDNKPLDGNTLNGIKLILKDSGSRILANHLTRIDLDLIFDGYKDEQSSKFGSGIELCTLPHGRQFRLDLIERTECLKLLVAVTILTCSDESERAEMLNKWIEVAIDTKTALGNLFGFCGIMLGLCSPQVEKLDSTWHLLRQKHTDSAFNFESKLRPTLKSMNGCSNPQAPNTTIPHLVPYALLIERGLDDFFVAPNRHHHHQQQQHQGHPTFSSSSLAASCLGAWESNSHDFGLGVLLAHLDGARKFVALRAAFRRNAEIVLGEARMDELTLEMFRTEFQLKFLWGSRGARAPPAERHAKFERVLEVIADKYCNAAVQQLGGGVEV